MTGRRAGRGPRPDDAQDEAVARIRAWLAESERASAGLVLDLAFAELRGVRQERWMPWSPLVDALTRPVSIRFPRWAWILLVLLLAAALSIVGLAGADRVQTLLDRLSALPAAPARTASIACSPALGADVACLSAVVPERHGRPNGPTVTLSVDVFGASNGSRPDPILVLDTFDAAGEQTPSDFAQFARSTGRPIVAVAPRGRGGSVPSLACPELQAPAINGPSGSLEDPGIRGAVVTAVGSCRTRLVASGIDLAAYDPSEQAADLESIRLGMGLNDWIVRGRGDEAPVILALLRQYPAHVRGAILVKPAVSEAVPAATADAAFGDSLRALGAMCAADPFCAGRYRPPESAFAAVIAALGTGGTEASVPSPGGGPAVTVHIDAALVRAALRDAMSGSTSLGTVPSQLDRMAAGDLTWTARRLLDRGWCIGSDLGCSATTGWSGGAELVLGCLDGDAAGSGMLDDRSIDAWRLVCPAWRGTGAGSAPGGPPRSDVPLVAIAAQIDPRRSTRDAEEALGGPGRAGMVVVPWAPEGLEFQCLGPAGLAWLDDPTRVHVVDCPGVGSPLFADAP